MAITFNHNDQVYVNGSNLGIGTSTPEWKLQIHENSGGANYIKITNDNTSEDGGNGVLIGISASEQATFWNYENTNMRFATNGTERVTITNTGNVGIGTASPSQGLEVIGNVKVGDGSADNYVQSVFSDGSETRMHGYGFYMSRTNSYIRPTNDGTQILAIGTDNHTWNYVAIDANYFTVSTNASEHFRITNTGNVGIGTTSPSYKLDVESGNIRVSSSGSGEKSYTFYEESGGPTGATVGYDGATNNLFLGTTGDDNATITQHLVIPRANGNVGIGTTSPSEKLHVSGSAEFKDYIRITNAGGGQRILLGNQDSTGVDNPSVIMGANGSTYIGGGSTWTGNGGTVVPIASFMDDGNVGIGTIDPTQRLSVAGNIALVSNNSFISFNTSASSGDPKIQMGSDGDFSFLNTAGSTTLHIENGGNVGIGTTSPESALQVVGTVPSSPTTNGVHIGQSSSANYGVIQLVGSLGGYIDFSASGDDRDGRILYQNAGNLMQFQTGSNTKMVINGDNVGIGTTDPLQLLHLTKTGSNPYIRISSDAFTGLDIGQEASAGNAVINLRDDKDIRILTNGSDVVRIKNTGNVGIGTTSPDLKLHLAHSDGNNGLLLEHTSQASGFQVLQNIRETEGLIWQRWSSGAFSSNLMTLTYSGELGIGTTSPDQKLQIHDSSSTGVYLHVTNSTTGEDGGNGALFGISSNEEALVWNYENTATRFSTNGTERIRITSDGNVGIGTTSPQALLQVGSVTSSVYSLATGNADIIAANKDISDTQMGTLNVTSTSRRSSSPFNQGYGPSITFTQNGSGYVDGYEKVIGGIKTEIRDANNLDYASVMQFYTHNNTALTAKMTIDADGNVGIGKTDPSAPLHINGGSTNQVVKIQSNSAPYIRFKEGGTDVGFIQFATDSYISNQKAGTLNFRTDNIDRMRIDGSGNVGIGTTDPGARLEVSDNTTGIGAIVGNTTHNSRLQIYTDAVGKNSEIWFGDAADDDIGKIDYDHIDNSLSFTTNTSEAMRITSGGNVGIGTTGPAVRLHVESGNTNHVALFESTDSTAYIQIRDNTGYSNIVNAFGHLVLEADQGQDQADSYMQFKIDASEKMRIIANGNVGIGTTSPNEKLHVESDGDGHIAEFKGSGTNAGGRNIRIGVGNTDLSELPTYQPYIYASASDSANNSLAIVSEGGSSSTGGIDFYTGTNSAGTTKRMRIDRGGNVGIGTDSPQSPLSVKSNSVSSANSGFTLISNATNNIVAAIGERATDGGRFHLYDAGVEKVAFYTDGTDNHISAGNVGIGTTSPGAKLEVREPANTESSIRIRQLSYNYWDLKSPASDTGFAISDVGGEKLRITSTGNVGIGTTSPGYKLDVSGSSRVNGLTSNLALFIKTNSSFGAGISFEDSTNPGNDAVHCGGIGSDFYIAAGYSEHMRVNSSGNVGIGTTSPNAKLDVNGSVRFSTITSGILSANASGDISATSASSLVQDNIYSPKGWKLTGSTYTGGGQDITSSTTQSHSGNTPVTRTSSTVFTATVAGTYEVRYQFVVKNNYADRCVVGAQVKDTSGSIILGSRSFEYLRYTTYGEYNTIQATFYLTVDANSTFNLETAIRSGSLNYTLESETGANAGHISFRLIKES